MYSYGLQQPGCILCLKLVIIGFSLSHFCDLFWNVTMIMNICFIWQFGGHSTNFAPVLPKTKSQQEAKTYLKLLLTLAESGWLWLTLPNSGCLLMTLADFWWLWLTLADSGCPPESVRVSQSQPELALVSQSQPVSAVVGQSQPTTADTGWLRLTTADSGWLWLTLTDSQSQLESARVIKSHPVSSESAKVSQILPESERVLDRFWALADYLGPLGGP